MSNYIVDSADLTSVANAIRTKGGTSAQLAFPAGFVSAVEAIETGGGDAYEKARQLVERTITEYIDQQTTKLGHSAFKNCSSLRTLQVHGVTSVSGSCIEGVPISALALPSLSDGTGSSSFGSNAYLRVLDLGEGCTGISSYSLPFSGLTTIIIRRSSSLITLSATAANQCPMKNGGAGVTVYIPKALYDHLGDGSSLDYKAASTWSTYNGYGTITWAQIEGSVYETEYGDGTQIPS